MDDVQTGGQERGEAPDDLQQQQIGKGYGEDEGEREQGLDAEE